MQPPVDYVLVHNVRRAEDPTKVDGIRYLYLIYKNSSPEKEDAGRNNDWMLAHVDLSNQQSIAHANSELHPHEHQLMRTRFEQSLASLGLTEKVAAAQPPSRVTLPNVCGSRNTIEDSAYVIPVIATIFLANDKALPSEIASELCLFVASLLSSDPTAPEIPSCIGAMNSEIKMLSQGRDDDESMSPGCNPSLRDHLSYVAKHLQLELDCVRRYRRGVAVLYKQSQALLEIAKSSQGQVSTMVAELDAVHKRINFGTEFSLFAIEMDHLRNRFDIGSTECQQSLRDLEKLITRLSTYDELCKNDQHSVEEYWSSLCDPIEIIHGCIAQP